MNFLSSTGDTFVESVELGKTAKAIIFECDFKDRCFYERLDDLLYNECQTPEKYDMVRYRKCGLFSENNWSKLKNKQADYGEK